MKQYSRTAKLFVAGGISLESIPVYAVLQPQVLIVGSGICSAKDPVAEARAIYEAIQAYL
jgi:3-hexulose-6-phosphate synthase